MYPDQRWYDSKPYTDGISQTIEAIIYDDGFTLFRSMSILYSPYSTTGFFRYVLLSLVILSLCVLIQPVSALIFLHNGSEITGDQIAVLIKSDTQGNSSSPFPIQFFYASTCGSCEGAEEYLHSLEKKNREIHIEFHNLIVQNPNEQLYNQYKTDYNRSDVHYPVLFLGEVGISGSSDIIWQTETLAQSYLKNKKR